MANAKKAAKPGEVFKVGDKVLIRTVTMYDLGKIAAITDRWIVLEEASWLATTGERFGKTLRDGLKSPNDEVEHAPHGLTVAVGSIVDVFPWPHDLPAGDK